MPPISLPPFNREFAVDQLAFLRQLLPKQLEWAQQGPGRLHSMYRSCLEYAGSLIALEPASPELPMVIEIAGQAQAALFARISAPPGQIVKVPIGPAHVVEYTAADPEADISPGDWVEGFHCALIARDGASLDVLAAAPLDHIRKAPGRSGEWAFRQVAAYQSFWLQKPDFVDRVLDALDAADPERIRADFAPGRLSAADVESIVHIALLRDVPAMKLLTRAIEGDVARFEEALSEALDLHHRWVVETMAENPGKQDASWFFATGPLAMLSLAIDRGLSIRVDSPYVPDALCAPVA